jgi:hypothetical protein
MSSFTIREQIANHISGTALRDHFIRAEARKKLRAGMQKYVKKIELHDS